MKTYYRDKQFRITREALVQEVFSAGFRTDSEFMPQAFLHSTREKVFPVAYPEAFGESYDTLIYDALGRELS